MVESKLIFDTTEFLKLMYTIITKQSHILNEVKNMNRLKILVKKRKAQKTSREYFAYRTILADGSYIDVKFNSQKIDVAKLPERTFIIYVDPINMNEKTKMRDGQPIMSSKTEKPIKELWISEIDHFADQTEIDKDNEEYRRVHADELAAKYPQA